MSTTIPATGYIDIHSHLLPGIDDGCQSVEESIDCVHQLKARGYVGSICTPHIWIDLYPQNTPAHLTARVAMLQNELNQRGIDYQIWQGGEVRIFDRIISWFGEHGVPTLADSNCVLIDLWEKKWPKWATRTFEWLIKNDYQPILAHPERLPCIEQIDDTLDTLTAMGVWLQCNTASMTGENGYHADHIIRKLLREDRLHFVALDMHRPNALPVRFDGLELIEMEFGQATLQKLTADAPRELILDSSTVA